MAVRLQEVHPSLVHLPLAFLPLAVGADLAGSVTDTPSLHELGKRAVGLAAASALVAATTGLIAQEEVSAEGEARDLLVTHRNLNLAATLLAGAMAVWRSRRRAPTAGYLALGLAGLGVVTYTAYLGGKMVYDHGVGVLPANGMYDENAPELRRGELGRVVKTSARDLAHAVPAMVRDIAHGDIAPALGKRDGSRTSAEASASGERMSG